MNRSRRLFIVELSVAATSAGIPSLGAAQPSPLFLARHGLMVVGTLATLSVAAAMAGPGSQIYAQNLSLLRIGLKIHFVSGPPVILAALSSISRAVPPAALNAEQLTLDLNLPALKTQASVYTARRNSQPGEVFYHYSFRLYAPKFAEGMRAGSYVTDDGTMTCEQAISRLALHQLFVPDAVYEVNLPAGTPVAWNPLHPTAEPKFGQPGGANEFILLQKSLPGSVSPPKSIPLR